MGLGSQDDQKRKEVRIIAGKSDWKAAVKNADDARVLIKKFESYGIDAVGKILIDAYLSQKIRLLEEYIANGNGKTLKEYVKAR